MADLPAFDMVAPGRLIFGRGRAVRAAEMAAGLGRRALLVHGRDPERFAWLMDALRREGCDVMAISSLGEPDLPALESALEHARGHAPDLVVAIGGGAVLDTGKALAALIPGRRPIMDHLEVVGRALPLEAAPLPMLALPTTAGTGAEVTRNAVIGVPESRRKVSLRDPRMVPDLAIVDPALTDGLPRAVTLASGLDALTQVIEPFLSSRAAPMSDALCAAAIPLALPALIRLMEEEEDPGARDRMAWVSLCGGLALAQAGLGAVHGLAGVIGGMAPDAPHGAVCGALLPHVLSVNAARLRDSDAVARMARVLGWMAAPLEVSAPRDVPAALAAWSRAQGLPGLTAMGLDSAEFGAVARAAQGASSMKPNPVPLDVAALVACLRAAA